MLNFFADIIATYELKKFQLTIDTTTFQFNCSAFSNTTITKMIQYFCHGIFAVKEGLIGIVLDRIFRNICHDNLRITIFLFKELIHFSHKIFSLQ